MTAGGNGRVALRHDGRSGAAVVEREGIDRKRRGGRVAVAGVHVRVDGEVDVGRQQSGGRGSVCRRLRLTEVRLSVARGGRRRRQLEYAKTAMLLVLRLLRLVLCAQQKMMSRVVAVDERRRRCGVVMCQRSRRRSKHRHRRGRRRCGRCCCSGVRQVTVCHHLHRSTPHKTTLTLLVVIHRRI